MNKQEHNALQLCVDALDQLLPYLAKVPADVGLLNSALMAARPLLKQEPAPAQDERKVVETVPRWKFHALVEHCKKQDQLISDLYARLNSVRLYDEKEVWFWQGDGCDHLESLVCPVVIEADELHRLVNAAPIAQTGPQPED